MSSSIFSKIRRVLARTALCVAWFVLFSESARAVELSLWTNNITMPSGRTFQMPLTGFDIDGQPLRFAAVVSRGTPATVPFTSPKDNAKNQVTAAIAPPTNRSLLLNVSGVDATNGNFTGDLVLQLFEDLTPRTTARIIDLVNSNFYDGLTFHRVIQNFVAQGGDPNGNGTGGSGTSFDDEFDKTLIYDGFGQLGMANSGHDSNDSQFFITDVDLSITNSAKPSPEHLNFQNPIFGQLTSGFDVLAKIIETPVNSSGRPLTPVVINSATVINSSQDGVLRLTAASKFTGIVTVTIFATNAENNVASQVLQVNVIGDATTSAPFLGPIPTSSVATQNTAITFPLTITDIDGLPTSVLFEDTDTGAFPTNLKPVYDQKKGRLFFSPDVTLTGTVNMIIGATDGIHSPDTQRFSLNFLPRSAAPTMTIVPVKGRITETGKPQGDRVKVSGTLAFADESDHTFGSNDVLFLSIGDTGTPFTVTVTPDERGWKVRRGVANARSRFTSGTSTNVNFSAQFNSRSDTFKISISRFNFPVPLTDPIQIAVAIGEDYGTDVRSWASLVHTNRFDLPRK
jgi:cyclophilin family peptidyl-prolyl cis-trans isomerase